jgi:hypothetical protein
MPRGPPELKTQAVRNGLPKGKCLGAFGPA